MKRRYGRPHRRVRAKYERMVAAGNAACARCGQPIKAWQPWDLDHDDDDPTGRRYLGPSHRHTRDCPAGGNRATVTHLKQRLGSTPSRQSREW
jgi:hypothetical protein